MAILGNTTITKLTVSDIINANTITSNGLVLSNNASLSWKNSGGTTINLGVLNSSNYFSLGYGTNANKYNTNIYGNQIYFYTNTSSSSTTPLNAFTLLAGGDAYFSGNIYLNNNKKICGKNSSSTNISLLTLDSTNALVLGEGLSALNYNLYLRGNRIIFLTSPSSSDYSSKTDTAHINLGGEFHGTSFYADSDIRYKNVLEYLNPSIKDISKLPIFNFTWKNRLSDAIYSGTSAQDVLKLLPNLVTEDDKLTLNYAGLGTIIGILAAREIVKLKERIKELEDKLNGFIHNGD